jgi:hypothetical protein
MQTFYEFIWNLFNREVLFVVGAWAGIPLTLILLIMFLRKKNRDERGWKIIGKASVVSFIYFILVVNLVAKILGYVVDTHDVHYLFVGNAIQWLYNTVIIVKISAISILRKIE